MQSILALTQFEHGVRLLQRTLRRRQVTQLRELERSGFGRGKVADAPGRALFGELSLEEGCASGDAEWNDMIQGKPHILQACHSQRKIRVQVYEGHVT